MVLFCCWQRWALVVFFVRTASVNDAKQRDTLIPVTLRLQWHIQTQFAGYYTASAKGFYEKEGLNVTIEQGGYGKNCLETVGEGLEEFGTKWMADLLEADDGTLISLANIVKDNGLLLITKKADGIRNIADFRGKRISIWFIGNEYQLFALLDKEGIARDEVTIVPQQWDMSQFYEDDVQVASAMSYNELLAVLAAGYSLEDLEIFRFSDFGVGFPGQNIFTSKAFYQEHPDICFRFIKASIEGWEYAVEHPREAVDMVLQYDEEELLSAERQLQQMNDIIQLIQRDKYPVGIQLKEDYERIAALFEKYGIIPRNKQVEDVYTNGLVEKVHNE